MGICLMEKVVQALVRAETMIDWRGGEPVGCRRLKVPRRPAGKVLRRRAGWVALVPYQQMRSLAQGWWRRRTATSMQRGTRRQRLLTHAGRA